jgi:hypothetical protein
LQNSVKISSTQVYEFFIIYFVANSYVVCDNISNILFSESLIETFLVLAQIIATVYQYSAKWDQPKKQWYVLKHYC